VLFRGRETGGGTRLATAGCGVRPVVRRTKNRLVTSAATGWRSYCSRGRPASRSRE
jgi:hypothetical protein